MYPLAVGLVIETKEIWDEITQALEEMSVRVVFELACLPPERAGFLDRINRVQPDVILLEVTQLAETLDDVMTDIRSGAVQPDVFALHREADAKAIISALRAGAREFLFPPLKIPLKAAFERMTKTREQAQRSLKKGGKTVAFVSAKGGCGATTVSCHVAAELPSHTKSKVLLADFDLQCGMIGFLVKADSGYSIADAANNLHRLDFSYWHALVSNGRPDLEIITAPALPSAKTLSPHQLKQVLAFARMHYPWTVADLGRNLNSSTLEMLDLIDETYLVTTQEIPALHQTKNMIQLLLEAGYGSSNLRLILNRMPKNAEVTVDELEGILGAPIYATLTNDYQALQDAHSEGRLVDASTRLGTSFSNLTEKISGASKPSVKKKFSLFG